MHGRRAALIFVVAILAGPNGRIARMQKGYLGPHRLQNHDAIKLDIRVKLFVTDDPNHSSGCRPGFSLNAGPGVAGAGKLANHPGSQS